MGKKAYALALMVANVTTVCFIVKNPRNLSSVPSDFSQSVFTMAFKKSVANLLYAHILVYIEVKNHTDCFSILFNDCVGIALARITPDQFIAQQIPCSIQNMPVSAYILTCSNFLAHTAAFILCENAY